MFFVVAVVGRGGGFVVVFHAGVGLVDEVTPGFLTGDHTVDGAPVREAADITVVDEEVGLEFSREVRIVISSFLGIVAVGSVELYTTLTTPVQSVVEQLALAAGPQHQAVVVVYEHLEGINGEGALRTNLGVPIFYYCSIKINCYYHINLF